jgi:hypothetical protein
MNKLQHRLCATLRAQLAGQKPRLPEGSAPFWRVFQALSGARSYHQFGPNPISFTEIAAYAALMHMPLAPHHVEILRAMDAVWLEHAYAGAGNKAPDGMKTIAGRAAQPLTAAMFDAMF